MDHSLKFMRDIAKRLVLAGLASRSDIKGCRREDIEEIQSSIEVPLPSFYRAFLEVMGRGAGKFFRGTDVFFPKVLYVREYAEDILKEDNEPFRLDSHDWVFSSHQGIQFMFFRLAIHHDDPPVYYYMEGHPPEQRRWEHFSEYMSFCVEDSSRFLRSGGG